MRLVCVGQDFSKVNYALSFKSDILNYQLKIVENATILQTFSGGQAPDHLQTDEFYCKDNEYIS